MAKRSHVIVVPYPAQGHVAPLMKFAYKIAENGIKVTFVTADFIHNKIISAMPHNFRDIIPINLVSILTDPATNHNDIIESVNSVFANMPGNLQKLIENINQENTEEPVSCVVADITSSWAIQIASRLGIKRAAVVPFGVGNLALNLHASQLIDSGIIDVHGIPLKDELMIFVSKDTPPWNTKELIWSVPNGGEEIQKFIFEHFILNTRETANISDWILVNSFYELEKPSYDMIPDALPIGPLLTIDDNDTPFPGNIWVQDLSCVNWLDQQPTNSVIYAAFGSSAICSQHQFHELAYALELIGRPFLWVVRKNFAQDAEFPQGFIERVTGFGKMVEWAPQEKVLSHPAIACFFSHCGWNSTIEGISKGVPFLCWPYYADQLRNSYYICEIWKVGVRVFADEDGIVTRKQIKSKMEKILSDQDIKTSSLKLKNMAAKSTSEGGKSFRNFMNFIEQIKQY